MKNDQEKQEYLEKLGLKVIRFSDDEVMKDVNTVMRRIEAAVNERLMGHTPVSPLDRGDL